MDTPKITKSCVVPLLETRFIKVYDLQYREGKHYYDATRRPAEDLTAVKTEEEFKNMLPDAVTCVVIIHTPDDEPRLLLSYEFRYPAGRYLLSPPAGLIDSKDKTAPQPLITTAIRELKEETGIEFNPENGDTADELSHLLFSTPGMTDESNGMVVINVHMKDLSQLSQAGAEGSECFDGFQLLTKADAKKILRDGRDEFGHFFSVYTFAAILYFTALE